MLDEHAVLASEKLSSQLPSLPSCARVLQENLIRRICRPGHKNLKSYNTRPAINERYLHPCDCHLCPILRDWSSLGWLKMDGGGGRRRRSRKGCRNRSPFGAVLLDESRRAQGMVPGSSSEARESSGEGQRFHTMQSLPGRRRLLVAELCPLGV